MNINRMALVAAGVAGALAGTMAFAQNIDEITVQGTRAMDVRNLGHTSSGFEVKDITLSYGVSLAGLDLTKHADFLTLDKRIHDAALAACKDIGKQYPASTPGDADCAKAAADKALVKANELAAAAGKKAAK